MAKPYTFLVSNAHLTTTTVVGTVIVTRLSLHCLSYTTTSETASPFPFLPFAVVAVAAGV